MPQPTTVEANMLRTDREAGLTGSLVADRYLDLLRDCLTRVAFPETWYPMIYPRGSWRRFVMSPFQNLLRMRGYYLCQPYQNAAEKRSRGLDWPPEAETMIGLARLANVRECCITAIKDGIPGDFCETGVWRGGACIFMRGVLEAMSDVSRAVWVCDSFEGLPKPTRKEDAGLDVTMYSELAVSLNQVKSNFARYRLLDDRVRFVKGWFRDTLPCVPIQQLAVLRLDGDLYESTWDAISNLYPKLSVGGFLIVDDYGIIDQCRQAIHDYRDQHAINDRIEAIDHSGVFWRKTSPGVASAV